MSDYGVFGDESYVNMNLSTEMELPQGRETVLHYFEQIRKRYPSMSNFYCREKDEFVLEEEKDGGSYRWISTEPKRLNSGMVNPESYTDACEQHHAILERVPYELSISPLDCESMTVVLGFDFNCKGNHNEILHEAIGVTPAFDKFTNLPYGKLLSNEPAIQFSLDDECKTQCRISFESRTTAFQIRSGEFSEEPLSVYLMVRRYDSLGVDENYASEFDRLAGLCRNLLDEYLIDTVLRPLQTTIAIR